MKTKKYDRDIEKGYSTRQMVAKLRERSGTQSDNREPTRVITVRMPKSLHESLRAEAHDRKTSMNKLCISKLLQVVGDELIPCEAVERAVVSMKRRDAQIEFRVLNDVGHYDSRHYVEALRPVVAEVLARTAPR